MGLLDEAIREHLDLKRRRGADPTEVDRLEREALGPVRRSPQDLADPAIGAESPAEVDFLADEEEAYPLEDAPRWDDPDAEPAPFDHASDPAPTAALAEDWSEPPTRIERLPEEESFTAEPEPTYDSPRHHEIAEEWEAHERGLAVDPQGFEPDEPAPAPPAPPPPAASTPPPAAAPDDSLFEGERARPAVPEHHDFEQETAEYRVEDELEPEPAPPAEAAEGDDVLEETPDFLQDTPDHDRLWFEQRPPRDFDFDG